MNLTPKIQIKKALLEAIKELCTNNRQVLLVSLCTADGFNIKSYAQKSLKLEADKIAAISSTLCALSDSTAKEVLKTHSDIMTIETPSGFILSVKAEYLSNPCILTVAVSADILLANARFIVKRLTNSIREMT